MSRPDSTRPKRPGWMRRSVFSRSAFSLGAAGIGVVAMTIAAVFALTGDDSEKGSLPQPAVSSAVLPDFHGDGTQTASPASRLRWSPAEADRVTALAGEVMGVFARRDVSAQEWWSDLSSYLSPAAQDAYAGTDPAEVPPTAVTGDVDLVDVGSALVAIAHVPTNAGLYAVTFSRSDTNPDWLVERITPPETGLGD